MLVEGTWEVKYREDLVKSGWNCKESAKNVALHDSKLMLYLMCLLDPISVTSLFIL